MPLKRRILFFFFLLCLQTQTGFAQLSYQISNYEINNLGAGNQNWDIALDEDERLYIANNQGLLIIENSNISLHKLSDSGILRSVSYINDTLYTGSFEDFGYWSEQPNGTLEYTSLAQQLENPAMNNDEIWKIVELDGVVYFHSFGSIYAYDKQVFRVQKDGSFMFLHKANERVFTQKIQGGLFELKEGLLIEIDGSNFLYDEEVKSVIHWEDDTYIIGTTAGIYVLEDGVFSDWEGEQANSVVKNTINSIIKANDKLIIGTILNGMYVYDESFTLLEIINTRQNLPNNTVLSLETDNFGNVWAGLDKGLTYVAFNMPLQTYDEASSDIGSVYTAALHKGSLYVGTNQGVYKYDRDKNGNFIDEQLIPGTQGQVWFLNVIGEQLYAGLNEGTFIISDSEISKVSAVFGGYTLKAPGTNSDKLVQSTYSDLLIYEKNNETWQNSYAMENFSAPVRYLEFDHLGNIWLGHSVRGIFKAQPNIAFTQIEKLKEITSEHGIPESSNRVFKLDNRIMSSYNDTLYQWDSINEIFVPYYDLNPFFTVSGTIKNIITAGENRYWVVKNNEISLFEVHFNSIKLLYRVIPTMYDLELVEGYENVIALSDSLHLICLDNGFSILNLRLLNADAYSPPQVSIETALALSNNSDNSNFNPIQNNSLSYSTNTVEFTWASTQIAGIQPFFQYRMMGIESEWSTWTTETNKRFVRLASGGYTFQVRSIGIDGNLSNIATYTFEIKKPWYFSVWAYSLYVVLFVSFGLTIRLYISRKRWLQISEELEAKHRKMRLEQERSEKMIIKLTNEKLQSEIEHKSAQLASNTMAMIRKNNLLSSIKKELEKKQSKLGNKVSDQYFSEIFRLINNGIQDEYEWELFEQLYDQAHGDFFRRFKEKYPKVTPSDLRLCAYLRMNLSSKEIAPLLNITVRGVEERRYRLRKRLDLDTQVNLNELIMTF